MSWKRVFKLSELVPFPPGSGEEESWMFPYDINETFVQSPRNRRRMSNEEPLRPSYWTRDLPHSHAEPLPSDQSWFHLVTDHGFGVHRLEKLNLDRHDIGQLLHSIIPHPKAEESKGETK